MSVFGRQIVVLGGDANDAFANKPSDPSIIHVLDTGKIKYPPEAQRPNGNGHQQIAKKSSMPAMRVNGMSGDLPGSMQAGETVERSSAPPSQIMHQAPEQNVHLEGRMDDQHKSGSLRVVNGPALAPPIDLQSQHQPAYERSAESTPQMTDHSSTAGSAEVSLPPDDVPDLETKRTGPPQRPRRDGDESLGDVKEHLVNGRGPSSNIVEDGNTPRSGESLLATRIRTSLEPAVRTESPTYSLREAWAQRSTGRTIAKSPPPPDAFYYGSRSPTVEMYGGEEEQSLRANHLRRQTELEEAQRRCQILSTAVGLALTEGLELPTGDLEDLTALKDLKGEEESAVRVLSAAILKLRESHVMLRVSRSCAMSLEHLLICQKNQLDEEKSRSTEHFEEMDRLRQAAIQEAAYLRARLLAIESGNREQLGQLVSDRQHELETRVSAQASAKAALEREIKATRLSIERLQTTTRRLEEEERKASSRAAAAEQECLNLRRELTELHSQKVDSDKNMREHADRSLSFSSAIQQHEAERTHFEKEISCLQQERTTHLQLIEEAKRSMSAVTEQAHHWQTHHGLASKKAEDLQAEVTRLRREAEDDKIEKEASAARLTELERAWEISQQEVASLRKLSDDRLQELLHTNRAESSPDGSRGQREKLQAVSQECSSLRKMLNEAGLQVSHVQSDLMQHRETVLRLEEEREQLRAELGSMKHSVRANESEMERLQQLVTSREADAQRNKGKLSDVEVRCAVLRNLLTDHGIATNNEDSDASQRAGSASSQLRSQLEDQAQQLKDSQNEVASLRRQLQEFSSREETLNKRMSVSKSPSLGSKSPTMGSMPFEAKTDGAPETRAVALENQADYQRMKQLEKDYKEAVAYVK